MTVDEPRTLARTPALRRKSWIGPGSSGSSNARCSISRATDTTMSVRFSRPLERVSVLDAALALRLNRAGRHPWIRELFRTISRIGDGVFWYGLMLALLVYFRADALSAVVHMVLTGAICTVLYKGIKRMTLRPRPYEAFPAIQLFCAPLDRFSFPSGHTLHAVAFTMVAVAYYPWLACVTIPFTLLVAASRVILGLHYPSDVVAGALVGALVAAISLHV